MAQHIYALPFIPQQVGFSDVLGRSLVKRCHVIAEYVPYLPSRQASPNTVF